MSLNVAEELVFSAIDEVNASFADLSLAKKRDALLVGEKDGIDSLAVVSLVVALESQIATRTGKAIVLVDENFFETDAQPLRSVGSLIDFVETILKR